ncbi:uncharacterized protein LOC105838504 isoform X2 [Monomorium pharaonis]|uniref:uncharacterized protein LOC105838504 isoform X2 n=1 Tax=Monomorium pharaonis TaxID=307658 RepID=UPI001747A053|nr:uncharacterized protein LOC105838504 isoform X2 [Monomorium pharaonis]
MTSLARIWRPFDLRRLTFRRKHGMFERSKDYDSRAMPPETTDDDSRCDSPCPPCPSSPPTPPPCPPPPTYHVPHSNPRKLAFWRMLSLCVAAPLIVIMSVVTYVRQREKMKEPREPYMDYPYMYRRTKPFPWGDGNHSLFHNPVKNPIRPFGYEVEDPNAPKKMGN